MFSSDLRSIFSIGFLSRQTLTHFFTIPKKFLQHYRTIKRGGGGQWPFLQCIKVLEEAGFPYPVHSNK